MPTKIRGWSFKNTLTEKTGGYVEKGEVMTKLRRYRLLHCCHFWLSYCLIEVNLWLSATDPGVVMICYEQVAKGWLRQLSFRSCVAVIFVICSYSI